MFASRSPRRRLPVLLGTAALGVALGGGLAGCGDATSDSASDPAASTTTSSSGSPSDSASAEGPACSDIWSEGGSLPSSYQGCVDDTGAFVKVDALGCSSGQRIVSYDDRFYSVPGGVIHMTTASLQKDHDYRAAVLRCRA